MARTKSLENAKDLLLKVESEYEAVKIALENELKRIK
jgi:hypothetical protein